MKINHEYLLDEEVTILIDGVSYKKGVIKEFRGTMVIVDTPDSEIHCDIMNID